ncbi:MAG: thermonuclease family protein [Candidatus Nitrosotenuis sp.]
MSLFAVLLIIVLGVSVLSQNGFAHRDGCHSWHNCQSDSGSYTCGDKGYCSQCSDNQYCKAGQPRSNEPQSNYQDSKKSAEKKIETTITPKKTEPIILKKQIPATKISTAVCTGKTMCISGKVKSIVDGDTLYVDTYKVRFSLVNTPERGQSGFSEATAFTKKMCPVGSAVIVDQDDKQPFDSFKRLVGKVYCSDKNLNYELLASNHASILKKYCNKSEFGIDEWATKYGC